MIEHEDTGLLTFATMGRHRYRNYRTARTETDGTRNFRFASRWIQDPKILNPIAGRDHLDHPNRTRIVPELLIRCYRFVSRVVGKLRRKGDGARVTPRTAGERGQEQRGVDHGY